MKVFLVYGNVRHSATSHVRSSRLVGYIMAQHYGQALDLAMAERSQWKRDYGVVGMVTLCLLHEEDSEQARAAYEVGRKMLQVAEKNGERMPMFLPHLSKLAA